MVLQLGDADGIEMAADRLVEGDLAVVESLLDAAFPHAGAILLPRHWFTDDLSAGVGSGHERPERFSVLPPATARRTRLLRANRP